MGDVGSISKVLAFGCLCMPLYSALREARQRRDRTEIDGHGLVATARSGGENPFRSHLLDQESLDVYQDLLNRPLPRLPRLYTLPSRYTTFLLVVFARVPFFLLQKLLTLPRHRWLADRKGIWPVKSALIVPICSLLGTQSNLQ